MKRLLLTIALISVAGSAYAQHPIDSPLLPEVNVSGSPGDLPGPSLQSVSPEVWMYMQERQRYDDPQQAVRRKAEARALARSARIQTRKWFGFSNSRPAASVTPFTDQYAPGWRGNGYHAYDWVGVGGSTAVIHLNRDSVWR